MSDSGLNIGHEVTLQTPSAQPVWPCRYRFCQWHQRTECVGTRLANQMGIFGSRVQSRHARCSPVTSNMSFSSSLSKCLNIVPSVGSCLKGVGRKRRRTWDSPSSFVDIEFLFSEKIQSAYNCLIYRFMTLDNCRTSIAQTVTKSTKYICVLFERTSIYKLCKPNKNQNKRQFQPWVNAGVIET